ncbi:MAG: four helix bundle protein [Flavobacteriaceae bacterium]|nr:four helix bundle protein [Flavobacteriaceae bacterium]|tara:strand:- start:29680 stop:30039 length:360 start_codon:yes stop_codon:yes gene_type:complete
MEYTKLEVWTNSRKLVKEIYEITKEFPKEEMYGIVPQMRRSAISIPSNIAEGSGRRSYKEKCQYLYIAKGSLFELETQLYLSKDLGFVNDLPFNKIMKTILSSKKLINGTINFLKSKQG